MANMDFELTTKTREVKLTNHVTVTLEEFEYQAVKRERPVLVVATHVGRFKVAKPRPPTPLPIALFHKGLKGAFDPMIPLDMDYGHLIALELGGMDVNASGNIVLMNSKVNRRGDWKLLERKLKKNHKLIKQVTIEVEYGFSDARVPSVLTATVGGSFKLDSEIKNLMSAPPTIYLVEPDFRTNYLDAASRFAKATGWSVVKAAKSQNVSLNVGNPPGPYAVLDYMWMELGTLKAPTRVQNGDDFKKDQRHNIMMANAIKNGGKLRSDLMTDPYKGDLSLEGGDTYPEIDHIISRTVNSGCNAYSNAQILSGQANKAKGGLMTKEEEVDDDDQEEIVVPEDMNVI